MSTEGYMTPFLQTMETGAVGGVTRTAGARPDGRELWTEADVARLCDLGKNTTLSWTEIAEHFENRSVRDCL